MSAAQIGAALKARLAALSFNPQIPVAWQNIDFDTDGVNRFMVAQIVPAPNQRLTFGTAHRRSGSLVVTVCSRMNNGSGEGDGIADAVAAHFPCDLILTITLGRLRITASPSVRGGFRDAGYWRTPVVIPYEILK